MVNNNHDDDSVQIDSDITYDTPDTTDTELSDEETTAEQKLKVIRKKLEEATERNRAVLEELQRTKADFLNARKRLEEDVVRTRERDTERHIEKLLPLADSFYLAMLDKTAWEQSDEKWRKGVEGIYQQLLSVLRGYGVASYDPLGQPFDPARHDALGSQPVSDEAQHHTVLSVMQLGYERTLGDTITVVRPARVTVGEYSVAGT